MSRIIDTKIGTNKSRPELKIGDKLYKVDNRKKTFDKITDLQGKDEAEDKIMELALGKNEAKEVLDLELTVEEYTYLVFCIIGAITGQNPDELQEEAKNQKN